MNGWISTVINFHIFNPQYAVLILRLGHSSKQVPIEFLPFFRTSLAWLYSSAEAHFAPDPAVSACFQLGNFHQVGSI